MKKSGWMVIAAVILIACLFQQTVSASPIMRVSIDRTDRTMTVSGSVGGDEGQQVAIIIFNPEGDLEYIGQLTSGVGGFYYLRYKMQEISGGSYLIRVSGETPESHSVIEATPTRAKNTYNEEVPIETKFVLETLEIGTEEMLGLLATFVRDIQEENNRIEQPAKIADILQKVNQATLATTSLVERIKQWNTPVIRSIFDLISEANSVLEVAKDQDVAKLEVMQLAQNLAELAEKILIQTSMYTVSYVSPAQQTASISTIRLNTEDVVGKAEGMLALYEQLQTVMTQEQFVSIRKGMGLHIPSRLLKNKTLQLEWSAGLLSQWQTQGIDELHIKLDTVEVTIPLDVVKRKGNEGLAIILSADFNDHPLDLHEERSIDLAIQVSDTSGNVQLVTNYNQPVKVNIPYSVTPDNQDKAVSIKRQAVGESGLVYVGGHDHQDRATLSFTTSYSGRFIIQYRENRYEDIQDVPWAVHAIMGLSSRGIVEDGGLLFTPQQAITTTNVRAWIEEILKLGNIDWAGKFKQMGSTLQSSLHNEGEGDVMTRYELAVMAAHALQAMNLSAPERLDGIAHFYDRGQLDELASMYVAFVVHYGLMAGHPGYVMAPSQIATRAEAAVVIDRLWNLQSLIR